MVRRQPETARQSRSLVSSLPLPARLSGRRRLSPRAAASSRLPQWRRLWHKPSRLWLTHNGPKRSCGRWRFRWHIRSVIANGRAATSQRRGGVCDSITSKFRCVDFARQPRGNGETTVAGREWRDSWHERSCGSRPSWTAAPPWPAGFSRWPDDLWRRPSPRRRRGLGRDGRLYASCVTTDLVSRWLSRALRPISRPQPDSL
jgi:hypothetical protein